MEDLHVEDLHVEDFRVEDEYPCKLVKLYKLSFATDCGDDDYDDNEDDIAMLVAERNLFMTSLLIFTTSVFHLGAFFCFFLFITLSTISFSYLFILLL